jgi:serine/threonine protein phosphatase PrpC
MAEILGAENLDLRKALKKLIDLANDRGGPDNITAVLARVPEGAIDQGGWAKFRKGK